MLSPLPRPSPSTPTVGRTSTDNNSENHICHWFWGSGMLPGGFPIPTCAERPRGNLGRPNAGPKIARRSLNVTPWVRASPSHLGNKSGNFCFSGQTTPGWSSENSSCINRSVVVIYIYIVLGPDLRSFGPIQNLKATSTLLCFAVSWGVIKGSCSCRVGIGSCRDRVVSGSGGVDDGRSVGRSVGSVKLITTFVPWSNPR